MSAYETVGEIADEVHRRLMPFDFTLQLLSEGHGRRVFALTKRAEVNGWPVVYSQTMMFDLREIECRRDDRWAEWMVEDVVRRALYGSAHHFAHWQPPPPPEVDHRTAGMVPEDYFS